LFCGIIQMLAMRDGQPCLVHEVGGLKDTVKNDYNGFSFKGETVEAQVDNFVQSFINAVSLKRNAPDRWRQICRNASAARFLWEDTVRQYLELLYR
jgi:starch synthase